VFRLERTHGRREDQRRRAMPPVGARLVKLEEAWAAHLVVKVPKERSGREFGFLRAIWSCSPILHLGRSNPDVGQGPA